MVYYYSPDPSDPDYKRKNRKKLENKIKKEISKYFSEVKDLFPNQKIGIAWTKKNTFGCVFTDYQKTYRGALIGKGESILIRKLRDKYLCLLLTENIEDDYSKPYPLKDGELLRLDITKFRDILSNLGNRENLVNLFLQEYIDDASNIESLQERVKKLGRLEEIIDIEHVIKFLKQFPQEKLDELQKVLDAILDLPKDFVIKREQIPKLMNMMNEIPDDYEIKPEQIPLLMDLLGKLPENFEVKPEYAENMIAMFIRLSKHYSIKEPKQLEEIIDVIINLLEKSEVKKPVELKKFFDMLLQQPQRYEFEKQKDLQNILTLSQSSILHNYRYFEKILREFKEKIDSDISEPKIRNFVYENIWLLDFKYLFYKKQKEEETEVGDIDISLYKNRLGTDHISIFEFKKPSQEFITEHYRGEEKPAILAEVGKALSQTMHYLETKRKKKAKIQGIIIIGRRKHVKDYFIDTFNKYLHGIQIITFDELYHDANDIVKAFREDLST